MRSISLIEKYNEYLLIPDPPQGVIMKGASMAAEWINTLSRSELVELESQLLKTIDKNSTDAELFQVIFIAIECKKPELLSVVKYILEYKFGTDKEGILRYSQMAFEPNISNKAARLFKTKQWGANTNKQIRGQKKKRGEKY